MENGPVKVDVALDGKAFGRFAFFDNFYRRKGWRPLVIFASILSVSACICFIMSDSANRAELLGGVLLFIGLGLPSFHIFRFSQSVKTQVKRHKLDTPKHVYTLSLSGEPDGVEVSNPGGESARYSWDSVYGAYRVDGCTYLYAAQNKAFLLPDAQIDGGAEVLWALLTKMLPDGKLHGRITKKV